MESHAKHLILIIIRLTGLIDICALKQLQAKHTYNSLGFKYKHLLPECIQPHVYNNDLPLKNMHSYLHSHTLIYE